MAPPRAEVGIPQPFPRDTERNGFVWYVLPSHAIHPLHVEAGQRTRERDSIVFIATLGKTNDEDLGEAESCIGGPVIIIGS